MVLYLVKLVHAVRPFLDSGFLLFFVTLSIGANADRGSNNSPPLPRPSTVDVRSVLASIQNELMLLGTERFLCRFVFFSFYSADDDGDSKPTSGNESAPVTPRMERKGSLSSEVPAAAGTQPLSASGDGISPSNGATGSETRPALSRTSSRPQRNSKASTRFHDLSSSDEALQPVPISSLPSSSRQRTQKDKDKDGSKYTHPL